MGARGACMLRIGCCFERAYMCFVTRLLWAGGELLRLAVHAETIIVIDNVFHHRTIHDQGIAPSQPYLNSPRNTQQHPHIYSGKSFG